MENTASIRASSRKTRVYIFREFLIKTYGEKYLSRGDIVLDAAGGKGDLSWLLCNVDSLDSVVVDPRVTNNNHIIKSVQYLRQFPEQAQLRAVPNLPSYQPLAALLPRLESRQVFESSRHLRILVNDDLVTAIRNIKQRGSLENSMEEWKRYWVSALKKGREARPLGYAENEDAALAKHDIIDAEVVLSTILSTKLVVGFHPDQATDSLIDLAMVLNIPFCCVPCCVFPLEFPNRKLVDGRRVRCYKELMEYLQSKSSSIHVAALEFNFTETAKNLALYTLPAAT
jgi:hypothetical protein